MSNNPLIWKLGLIAAVVVAAAIFFYPPGERINLGLDLQGGLHILMEVETGAALKYELDLTQSRLGQRFDDEGISYESILSTSTTTLELRGTEEGEVYSWSPAIGQQTAI